MADKSRIEWTEATWNPTTGCDRVSPGCDHCYAMSLAPRLKAMGSPRYQRDGDPRTSGPGFGLTLHSATLAQPLRWTKPRRIFVNSMSDLFHDEVPDRFIADVFAVMSLAKHHTFQLLTKRHGRMRSLLNSGEFWIAVNAARLVRGVSVLPGGGPVVLPNVWIGVSVEDQRWADIRIPALLETPAAVRWLSMEPLLGLVELERPRRWLDPANGGVNWVVVGGESGQAARPMHPHWARSLRDQCTSAGVPFFFKQWGEWAPTPGPIAARDSQTMAMHPAGMVALTADNPFDPFERGHPHWEALRRYGKKTAGRELDGRTWDEYPAVSG